MTEEERTVQIKSPVNEREFATSVPGVENVVQRWIAFPWSAEAPVLQALSKRR